jgi:hypothetical protein
MEIRNLTPPTQRAYVEQVVRFGRPFYCRIFTAGITAPLHTSMVAPEMLTPRKPTDFRRTDSPESAFDAQNISCNKGELQRRIIVLLT